MKETRYVIPKLSNNSNLIISFRERDLSCPYIQRNLLLSTMSRWGTEDVNVTSVTLDVWSLGILSYY